jgi:hypothetical protein
MTEQQEELSSGPTQLRQEIQTGLDSGDSVEITDLEAFMNKCHEEALSEGREIAE